MFREGVCLLVLAVAVVACKRGHASIGGPPAPQGRDAPTKDIGSVTAEFVFREYAKNETRADRQFNDRWWEITVISADRIKGRSVWMKSRDDDRVEMCLTFEDEADIVRLDTGDVLSAKCEGDGVREDAVLFEGCVLTSRSKPPAPQAHSDDGPNDRGNGSEGEGEGGGEG